MPFPFHAGGTFYFPNIIMKLCRSNLPPHQAVFYCPKQLNKFDIKEYLTKLYDLKITDVRTMNYLGKPKKINAGGRVKSAVPSYKKVIITMEQDFIFPPPPNVTDDNALRLPPRVRPGKSSTQPSIRKKILEQAEERGIDIEKKSE